MSLPERQYDRINIPEESAFSPRQSLLFAVVTRKPLNDFMWRLVQAEKSGDTNEAFCALFDFPENLYQALENLPIDTAFPEYRGQKLLEDAKNLCVMATSTLIDVREEKQKRVYVQKESLWGVNRAVRRLYQHLEHMFSIEECEEFIACALHDIQDWYKEKKYHPPAKVDDVESYRGLLLAGYNRLKQRKKTVDKSPIGMVHDSKFIQERMLM
ncbi:MAG TPA: hypothetical protein VJH96_04690 [Patescibacteria group bacterium]|nr:hypothetical protein [Patescibacteria group bacterium]